MNVDTSHRGSQWWKGNRNRVFAACVVISAMTAGSASAVLVPGVAGATGSCPTVATDGTVTPAPSPGVDWDGCDFTDGGTTTANLSNADLAGADLANANLTGANLTNADLNSANLTDATLSSANLTDADLTDADFEGAALNESSGGASTVLTGTVLDGTVFDSANLYGVISGEITGTPASLPVYWSLLYGYLVGAGADLEGADFAGLELANANFVETDLTGADFANADLTDADLGANLTDADLTDATMTGADLNAVTFTNLTDADLSGANASDASFEGNLDGANMGTTDLQGARVIGTDGGPGSLPPNWFVTGSFGLIIGPGANASGFTLIDVGFPNAELQGIDFQGTNFFNVDMANDNLTGADLTGAALGGVYQGHTGPADLTGATLTDTNLEDAQLGGSELTGVISGGIVGTPTSLPTHWGLFEGYLRTATVFCSKVTGSASRTVTLEKCEPKSVDNTSASLAGSSLDSAATVTWSPSGQSTDVAFSSSSPGRGLCKAHRTEVDVSGPVVGGTSTYTDSDDWVSMQLCEKKSGVLKLAPDTTAGL